MVRKLLSVAVLLASMAVLQTGCGSDDGDNGVEPPPPPPPRVIVQAHQDPTFDGALDSPVWDSITAVNIPIGTDNNYIANDLYKPGMSVDMKALIADDSLLYIWVRWDDGKPHNRFGELWASWVNNEVTWLRNYPADTQEFNEDRFYMIFDRGGPSGADCASFCHTPGDTSSAGKQFYGAAGDDVDIWHWKAHRTGLARLAEDMHLTTVDVSPDPQGPNLADSLYFTNFRYVNPAIDSVHIVPKYMHENDPTDSSAGLLESEVIGDFFALYNENLEWIYFPPGSDIPTARQIPGYYILDQSGIQGSRWDVRAKSEHDGTSWTIVFRRALATGDTADRNFEFSIPDSVSVSIAVADNSGIKHFGRKPFQLIFE